MKIIIPMAGHSRRFQAAGYTVPKPFIMIDGKPMIERVCRMFAPNDEFFFVCQRSHLGRDEYHSILSRCVPNSKIISIDPHDLGPVYSALEAKEYIMTEDEPVIISYCDFYMQWDYRRFLMNAELCDGAIPCFRGFHPASFGDTYYAYVRTNAEMEMLELREKQSFTEQRSEEFASTGVYYFDSWTTYEFYARKLLDQKLKVGSEYYCSLLFNLMRTDQKRVCAFEVEKFICWGTPEDLAEYNFWSTYFSKQAGQTRAKELARD